MQRGKLKIFCFLIIFVFILSPYIKAEELSDNNELAGESNSRRKLNIINDFPMETVNTEYILGPGDKIEIAVYRHDELTKTFLISPSGKIIYPLLGEMQIAGLTILGLKEKITDGLLKYIIDPKVGVNLISVQSYTLTVLGEVTKPGYYNFNPPLTILEAISMAGGFTEKADRNKVMLIRSDSDKPQLKTINFKKVLKEADFTRNILVQKGDIICVPESFF